MSDAVRAGYLFLAATFVVMALPASAADAGCEGNPALTGKCYWVWGTGGISADNADMIWRDDNHRGMTVREAPNSHWYPRNVERALRKTTSITGYLHGRWRVCPIPAEPSDKYGLPWVCLQAATHLSVPRE